MADLDKIAKTNSQTIKDTMLYTTFLKEVYSDIETSINLIKNGKEIPCYNKLLGIKQRVVNLYTDIDKDKDKKDLCFLQINKDNENNKDS